MRRPPTIKPPVAINQTVVRTLGFSSPAAALGQVVAWPVAWLSMNWWLRGFAYHVDQPWWLFFAAGGAVTLIAWLTVGFHVAAVASAKPVTALRYE